MTTTDRDFFEVPLANVGRAVRVLEDGMVEMSSVNDLPQLIGVVVPKLELLNEWDDTTHDPCGGALQQSGEFRMATKM